MLYARDHHLDINQETLLKKLVDSRMHWAEIRYKQYRHEEYLVAWEMLKKLFSILDDSDHHRDYWPMPEDATDATLEERFFPVTLRGRTLNHVYLRVLRNTVKVSHQEPIFRSLSKVLRDEYDGLCKCLNVNEEEL